MVLTEGLTLFLFTKLIFCFFCFFFISCAGTPPLKEYTLARSALKHAKKYQAGTYAPLDYRKSISLYREAQAHFKNRYYGSAREAFRESRDMAEKAEEVSRWKEYKQGNLTL